MALVGSTAKNGKPPMLNDEITGRDGDGQDYDIPPPAVSVRQVEQFNREKEVEATSKSASVAYDLQKTNAVEC